MEAKLFYFVSFFGWAFLSVKGLLHPRSRRFTSKFSSKSCTVLVLTIKSIISMTHLELIFVQSVDTKLDPSKWDSTIPLSQHCLLKRLFFPPLNYLGTLTENQLIINMRVCFWILNSIPGYGFILLSVSHCLVYNCIVIVSFEIVKCEPSSFVILFQDCLWASYVSMWILESACQFLQESQLGI